EATVASETASAGGVASVTVIGRQVGSSTYSARLRFEGSGQGRLYLMRDETLLGGAIHTLSGTYTAGEAIKIKVKVSGTTPTTTAAKIWRASESEPAGWQIEATDSTAGLQAAGFPAIRLSLSAASTNAVQRILVDDYLVSSGD